MDTQRSAAVIKTVKAWQPQIAIQAIHVFPMAGQATVVCPLGKVNETGQFVQSGVAQIAIEEPQYTALVDQIAAMEPGENLLDPIWAAIQGMLGLTLE